MNIVTGWWSPERHLADYFRFCFKLASFEGGHGICIFYLFDLPKEDFYLVIHENSIASKFSIHASHKLYPTLRSIKIKGIDVLLAKFCDINFLTRKLKQPIRAGDIFKINNPQEGFGAEIVKIN